MITQVLTSGFGGQGVVLSGVVLGQAGVLDGLYVAQAASYGAEARGSACKCGVILSDRIIAYPHVTEVDWLLAMSQDGYDKFLSNLADNGRVIYDQDLVKPDPNSPYPHTPIPVTSTALMHFNHRMSANMIFLAAAVSIGNFVTHESLEKAMLNSVPKQHHEINLKAINLGFQLTNNQQ